jgi:hypothetical protein
MRTLSRLTVLVVAIGLMTTFASAQKTYIGASNCKMCHQTAKQGEQFKIWSGSKHAEAFKVLASPEAQKIRKGAEKDAECLSCHVTAAGVDAKMLDKKFKMEDGVQCESCHGAGSGYKTMAVMKDHAKAVAGGMVDFKDETAIEKMCKTCHNDKSPTFKGFNFKDMWDKIDHPVPKS